MSDEPSRMVDDDDLTFDDDGRNDRPRALYAPAQPFVAAADEWITAYLQWRNGQPYAWLTPLHVEPRAHGMRELAVRAGINRESLFRLMDGRKQVIELGQADKLAIALGISLWALADDFLPYREALELVEQVTA